MLRDRIRGRGSGRDINGRALGSWVTSIWQMEELVERIARWGLHPADLITHRYGLDKVGEAYDTMASGECGKVAVVFDEETA